MKDGWQTTGAAPAGYLRLTDNGPTTVAYNKAGDEPAGYIGV
jgi:hypothetical protein